MECVIVSYRSGPEIGRFAEELDRDAFDRVLVVDNASGDDSPQIARASGFDVMQRSRNDGFGAAANDGIAATTSDLVVLLNPDVHVRRRRVIESLARHFADPRVAVAAPALRLPDGRLQDSARTVPAPWELVRRRQSGAEIGGVRPTGVQEVPWVVGAFMMLRRSAFDAVGGFDPGYFLYFEDVDLSTRLRDAGWSVRYDPGEEVDHVHQAASRAAFTHRSTRQHVRSALRYYRLHPKAALGRAGRAAVSVTDP